ncbi:hypothetical protein BLOT_012592 [Blomia tropicalis]|nr:hypothetical protein BLOT_012592 [Blomia tropicalis]
MFTTHSAMKPHFILKFSNIKLSSLLSITLLLFIFDAIKYGSALSKYNDHKQLYLVKRQITDSPIVSNKLTVSAGDNQTIQLPNDQTVLSSFVVPPSQNYKYSWELISPLNKEDIGNIEGLNKDQIKLSHLKIGNYTFRVTVTGDGYEPASAITNLTVLPPKRINKPPIAIIEPKNSTVQLPNKDTVLDGSTSSDDEQIVKYEWQAIKVPIGYKNLVSNSSTLKLNDLVAGLYVFNLTVTDSKNATNSTTATINVLKEIDYPPTANAGPDVFIHLPQNTVVLNGSLSRDDKGIAHWLWSRADDGQETSVDMEGTATPFLTLSNLHIGVYKFFLTVTDTSNQLSKAETHVFVKPENNEAPKANAGEDQRIVLPLKSSVFLNGNKSSDDIKIVKWEWKQLDGPKNLLIYDSNTSIARIDNLIPGRYNFSLTVWDTKNLTSSDELIVDVIQNGNIPPKAIAGGDQKVTLPINEVMLNGSASYDDAGIVSYVWERMPMSLAYGDFIGNSSNSPILRLTNLVSGRYLFKLTVTDAHGATSSDVASLIVRPSPDMLDQIELVLNNDVQSFTYDQQCNIYQRLEDFLSGQGRSITIEPIKVDKTRERRTILIFVARDMNNHSFSSIEIVRKIKSNLKSDPNLLSLQVSSLDTLICQNNCSFHGTCDQYTKRCMCEAFWMENIIRLYFGDNQSNCEWSILYVIIICFALVIMITTTLWICIFAISRYHQRLSSTSSSLTQQRHRKRKYKRTNRFRYMLIDQCDNLEIVCDNKKNLDHSSSNSSGNESTTIFVANNQLTNPISRRSNVSVK